MRRKFRKAKPKEDKKPVIANEKIRFPEVFVINEEGEPLGNKNNKEALGLAQEVDLDLVLINPKANPPIVKIMDLGQHKYEQEKKAHKQKTLQKKVETKGIRLSVRISEHDFNFRVKQAEKFLAKGNKLKIEIVLKGREKQHPEKAKEIIMNFARKLEENEDFNIFREQDLTKQGGRFTMILANKKN